MQTQSYTFDNKQIPCPNFEWEIQQQPWSKAEDVVWTPGSGKTEGTYCTGVDWGNELFLAGTSESTMKARLGSEGKMMGGWEGEMCWATCSQGFRCWPDSAAIEVWVGRMTSMQADVGRHWEFLQFPGVCNMLGPPDHPWSSLPERWEEKACVRGLILRP